MKNRENLIIGMIAGILFLVLFNISSFVYNCNEIRNDTLRLHIIANSDTEKDQRIKLAVRDALLESGSNIFSGTVTPETAFITVAEEKENIEKTVKKILNENGVDYNTEINLTTEYFDTRVYDNNVTLPAGQYLALKIVLGEGNGKNWWCVMFPSLCLPAAEETDLSAIDSVYSENEKLIISNGQKYTIRFKLLEYLEKFKNNVTIIQQGDIVYNY